MSRPQLATLLRLRELAERRELARRSAAALAVDAAEGGRRVALRASARHLDELEAVAGVAALAAHRVGELAIDELVLDADEELVTAARRRRDADLAVVAAAVARKSSERLLERRAEAAALAAARVRGRREDDVALQAWRRTR